MIASLFELPADFITTSLSFAGEFLTDFREIILLVLGIGIFMWILAFWFGGERVLTGKEITEELEEKMEEIPEEEEEEDDEED